MTPSLLSITMCELPAHLVNATEVLTSMCSAQQYIAGTTKNPLVVSFNVTNRSDKRIYESDGNKTIAA
jgi:hypothetical protein